MTCGFDGGDCAGVSEKTVRFACPAGIDATGVRIPRGEEEAARRWMSREFDVDTPAGCVARWGRFMGVTQSGDGFPRDGAARDSPRECDDCGGNVSGARVVVSM